VVTIGNALRDSVGSAKRFRALISQLRSFETALIFVRRYAENNQDEENAVLAGLVRASQDGIDDILDELDEYQSHLGPANKIHKSRVKDSISKIKFVLFTEGDIEKWERRMMMHGQGIIMMQTAYVNDDTLSKTGC